VHREKGVERKRIHLLRHVYLTLFWDYTVLLFLFCFLDKRQKANAK
jgi:hypothetical protein